MGGNEPLGGAELLAGVKPDTGPRYHGLVEVRWDRSHHSSAARHGSSRLFGKDAARVPSGVGVPMGPGAAGDHHWCSGTGQVAVAKPDYKPLKSLN